MSLQPVAEGFGAGGYGVSRRLRRALPARRGGGQLLLYGTVGMIMGFAFVGILAAVVSRPAVKAGPVELRVKWRASETAGDGQARFEGGCTIERTKGRLLLVFPSGGPWTVHVNDRLAFGGRAPEGGRKAIGRAADWLHTGANTIRAVSGHETVTDPPRLLLE